MRADQQNYLIKLVRRDIVKSRRRIAKLEATARPAREQKRRLDYIEDVYRRLGGDPAQITA